MNISVRPPLPEGLHPPASSQTPADGEGAVATHGRARRRCDAPLAVLRERSRHGSGGWRANGWTFPLELSGENLAIPLAPGWVGRAVPARRNPSCRRTAPEMRGGRFSLGSDRIASAHPTTSNGTFRLPAARGLAALPGFARTKSQARCLATPRGGRGHHAPTEGRGRGWRKKDSEKMQTDCIFSSSG